MCKYVSVGLLDASITAYLTVVDFTILEISHKMTVNLR